jgi:GNAT superfamily N-acetyltransferase
MNLHLSDNALRRIEEISQNASRPECGAMVDGWSVGLSPSKAKRSRCVNAFYASTRPFETNLAAVRALYKQVGLPCMFRLTRFVADSKLDERLAMLGGEKFDETHVQHCALSPQNNGREAQFVLPIDYSIKSSSSPDTIGHIVQKLRGDSDEEITALVSRWNTMPSGIRSYTAVDASHRAAAHVLTISEEHCVGVFDVVTHPEHRARGLASALIARALADAREQGATDAYLQVVGTNPARRVYERLGFRTAYTYWYRQLPEL